MILDITIQATIILNLLFSIHFILKKFILNDSFQVIRLDFIWILFTYGFTFDSIVWVLIMLIIVMEVQSVFMQRKDLAYNRLYIYKTVYYSLIVSIRDFRSIKNHFFNSSSYIFAYYPNYGTLSSVSSLK